MSLPVPPVRRPRLQIYAAMAGFALIASLTNVLAREFAVRQSPYWIAFWRFIIAAPALAVLLRLSGRRILLMPVDRWRFVLLAMLAVPGNQLLYIIGIRHTTATHAALLYGTTPAWVLLLAVALDLERLRNWKVAGIFLSITGVVVVLAGKGLAFSSSTLGGDMILMMAVLAWAGYTTLGKPLVERYGALEVTFLVMSFGALMYLPIGLPIALLADYSAIEAVDWLFVLYLGLVTSVLAYFLWYWLVASLRPTQVAVVMCSQPPITFLLAALLQGEQLTTSLAIGSLITLAGIALTVVVGGEKRAIPFEPARPPGTR